MLNQKYDTTKVYLLYSMSLCCTITKCHCLQTITTISNNRLKLCSFFFNTIITIS